jgi:hypothetical protein
MNPLILLSLLVLTLSQTCPNCQSGCTLSSTGASVCQGCNQGYALVNSYASPTLFGSTGTCTVCQTGCASCQFIQEYTNQSPCGPTLACGINNLYCNYCNSGYTTQNGVCYPITSSTTALGK